VQEGDGASLRHWASLPRDRPGGCMNYSQEQKPRGGMQPKEAANEKSWKVSSLYQSNIRKTSFRTKRKVSLSCWLSCLAFLVLFTKQPWSKLTVAAPPISGYDVMGRSFPRAANVIHQSFSWKIYILWQISNEHLNHDNSSSCNQHNPRVKKNQISHESNNSAQTTCFLE